MHRKLALALLAATAIAALLPALAADDALLMVPIDVEGGGGTLFVTPHGKSVLIDTGNPDRGEHPNSENIDKTARAFGLKKIDYLITTHYHVDHIGGLEGLLKRIPIGTFIDHGANRELPGTQGPGGMIGPDWRTVGADGKPLPGRGSTTPPPPPTVIPPPGSTAAGYAHYIELIGKSPHRVVKAGDHLDVDGMHILFVDADGEPLAKPLPGAGEKPAACATMQPMGPNGGEENSRSTSSLITYGKTKIAAFGEEIAGSTHRWVDGGGREPLARPALTENRVRRVRTRAAHREAKREEVANPRRHDLVARLLRRSDDDDAGGATSRDQVAQ